MTFGTRRPLNPEIQAELEALRIDPAPQDNLERVWSRVERSIAGAPDGPKSSGGPPVSHNAPEPPSLRRVDGAATAGGPMRRALALFLGGLITGVPLGTLLHMRMLSRNGGVASSSPIVAPRLGPSFGAAATAAERPAALATGESSEEPPGAGALAHSANPLPANAVAPDPSAADPRGRRSSGASTLAQERLLLDEGRRALGRDDARDALRWTDLHKARFVHPELGEEREAIAIQALAADGQYDEARRRAARFLSATPNSLFRPAVETALSSIP